MKKVLFSLGFICLLVPLTGQVEPVQIPENFSGYQAYTFLGKEKRLDLREHVYYLGDPQNRYQPAELLLPEAGRQFERMTDRPEPLPEGTHWFRLDLLGNGHAGQEYLLAYPQHYTQLRVYEIAGDSARLIDLVGYDVEPDSNHYRLGSFDTRLYFSQNEAKSFLFQGIRPRQPELADHFRFALFPFQNKVGLEEWKTVLRFSILTIVLTLLLYHLVLFLRIKQNRRYYFYFFLLTIPPLTHSHNEVGLAHWLERWLWRSDLAWAGPWGGLEFAVFQFFTLMAIRGILDLPRFSPFWNRLYQIVALLILIDPIFQLILGAKWSQPFFDVNQPYRNMVFLLTVLIYLGASWTRWRQGSSAGRWVFWGILLLETITIYLVFFFRGNRQIPELLFSLTNVTIILGFGAMAVSERHRELELAQQRSLQEKEREKLEQEKKVNERLRRVDQLKDQFLANTSHELRTPLQGIIGLSESLAERVEKRDQREDLSMIISSGKRLNNLVNDILDFSKLKNRDIELVRKPVNLRVLTDVILRNHIPLIRGKDLQLFNQIPEDIPPAYGDENRLQQVLYNLIGNAVKFTEKGRIQIDAKVVAEEIQVSVSDTGMGIPEDKQELIFQEFEQGDGSVSREFSGTGLGLSISRRLVELHGGRMWVESKAGAGSTFFFTLPCSGESASTLSTSLSTFPVEQSVDTAPTETREVPLSIGLDKQKIRILVVDDEPINQRVLESHLSGQNFYLTQAMNGAEALDILERDSAFDLVLLDIMMPRMSGYEVCQKIRERFLPSELPVIMITAKNQLQDIVEGLTLGANDYVAKPFRKEELLARIKTQLDLHHIFDVAGRFVPNEFLRSLNRERLTEVSLGDFSEKEVSVLFSDIRDYTALAETMSPQENFQFIKTFHGLMGPIIPEYRGFVNQYLGDAIMAIFPTGPESALQAAIAMQKRLADYNRERQAAGKASIRMGIGLHAGPLIMGIIGDQNRLDAATIADTVNTASRIESLTKYYGTSILLSEEGLQNITDREQYHLRYLGKVQLKGKKEPTVLYECFSGEAPAAIAKKMTSRIDFETGMQQYFSRDFAEAAATFSTILKKNEQDQPARLFMNKASKNLINGVPDDWTGVEVMSFK